MAPRERSSLVEVDDDENDNGAGYSSYDNCDSRRDEDVAGDAPLSASEARGKSKKVSLLPSEKDSGDDRDEEGPSTPLLPTSEDGEAEEEGGDGQVDHDGDRANHDDEGDDDADEEEDEDDCVRKSCFTLSYHLSYIVRLTPKLLKFLFHGTPRWLLKLVRLLLFVACLLPAFIRFGWYYWISSDRRVVCYRGREEGGCSRHFADVYGSNTPVHHSCGTDATSSEQPLKPVVVFLTGGAWIIGYKMWGALLARALTPFGLIVVIPDYRNFPHARVDGMVDDVDRSVQWTLEHIGHFGGDRNKVVLVGQSAGAHLGSCVVLIRCLIELDPALGRELYPKIAERATSYNLSSRSLSSSGSSPSAGSEPPSIKGFVPVSGPYDLIRMRKTFHEHGLDKNLVSAIFNGGKDGKGVERYSPAHILKKCLEAHERRANGASAAEEVKKGSDNAGESKAEGDSEEEVKAKEDEASNRTIGDVLPPIKLLHGTADGTVPVRECTEFAALLQSACSSSSSDAASPDAASTSASSSDADADEDGDADNNDVVSVERPCIDTLLYDGWSHTDPILEGPFEGDQRFHREVYDLVKEWTMKNEEDTDEEDAPLIPFDNDHPVCRPVCPRILIRMGRFFNPF
uniref:BD-FAE-like domain-containing protein n=1 Tax=Pseudictyota dubia TaxID=2749911 RepID=A0A7R9VHK8_9STRA|mmetsp:Transcript_13650/g.25587  ORF Transcript_13650/g.25587 Transcript_13650/m.25587 type:complete len:628 (+) Transcript_13650:348-2231(+)